MMEKTQRQIKDLTLHAKKWMEGLLKAREYLLENNKNVLAQKHLKEYPKGIIGEFADYGFEMESPVVGGTDADWIRLQLGDCYLFLHDDGSEQYQWDPRAEYGGELIDEPSYDGFIDSLNNLAAQKIIDAYEITDIDPEDAIVDDKAKTFSIYLAGSCSSEQRTLMKKVADHLRGEGHEVYCPFELKIENAWDYSQEDWAELVFKNDIKALDKADIVVMVSQGRMSSAGTNWEQGYAYAKGKKVCVLQTTELPTSLMTFCGCSTFRNTKPDYEYFFADINSAIYDAINGKKVEKKCLTVLT